MDMGFQPSWSTKSAAGKTPWQGPPIAPAPGDGTVWSQRGAEIRERVLLGFRHILPGWKGTFPTNGWRNKLMEKCFIFYGIISC